MRVTDSDGHFHEPHYLFEEYIEKEYWGKRPRVVKIQGHSMEEGRWVVEGKVVPRIPLSKGWVPAASCTYRPGTNKCT